MSFLRDFAQWIKEQNQQITFEVEGRTYSRSLLHLVEPPEKEIKSLPHFVEPFKTSSLSSVVEYIKRKVDQRNYLDEVRYIIHVVDHETVLLTTETLRDHEARIDRVVAKAQLPKMPYGDYVSREQMNIMLQTMFVDDEKRREILSFIGRIVSETTVEESDDGVGQSVTVKAKVGSEKKGKERPPAAFLLAPFRTFTEARQPASPFILRLKQTDGGVQAALFEADGGAWKIEAMHNIRRELEGLIEKVGLLDNYAAGKIVILA